MAFRALPAVSCVGLAGLCTTAVLGFEQANTVLLAACGVALLASPASVVLDVWIGRSLRTEERARWLARLKSRSGVWAISEYIAEAGGFQGESSREETKQ